MLPLRRQWRATLSPLQANTLRRYPTILSQVQLCCGQNSMYQLRRDGLPQLFRVRRERLNRDGSLCLLRRHPVVATDLQRTLRSLPRLARPILLSLRWQGG